MRYLNKTMALKLIVRTLGVTTRRTDRLRILTYHSIQDHPNTKAHMPRSRFEEHVQYFLDKGYRTLTTSSIGDDFPTCLKATPSVALTFDDGLYNNWTVVCEILLKHKMTGTFFIPTSYVSDVRNVPKTAEMSTYWDTRMLSWSDIRDIAKAGFEVGAHSHTHVKVAQQSPDRALEEISLPKKILEDKLGIEIRSFAYPKGLRDSFSTLTRGLVINAGYSVACTQLGGYITSEDDLLELPRQGMVGTDTLAELVLKLRGNYDCLRMLR